MTSDPTPRRLRRLRRTEALRTSVAETHLAAGHLVEPHFVVPGTGRVEEIPSMPGIPRVSPDVLVKRIEAALDLGLQRFLLFGVPETKDAQGRGAADPEGPVPTALRVLRDRFGDEIVLLADVCLCAYTTHGHCGLVDEQGCVLNDASLPPLAEAAVTYAKAGADGVAPSDMMDGRVAHLRGALEAQGLTGTALVSYAVKYHSAFYGPFRHAQDSAPRTGDRASYQLDPRNGREALAAARRDVAEGADALIVKPGLPYLDILSRVREHVNVPVAAYNVSGEYAMVKAAARAGHLDEARAVPEALTCLRRAGADLIVTYHARQALEEGWI